jgi:hypothetical protein
MGGFSAVRVRASASEKEEAREESGEGAVTYRVSGSEPTLSSAA